MPLSQRLNEPVVTIEVRDGCVTLIEYWWLLLYVPYYSSCDFGR